MNTKGTVLSERRARRYLKPKAPCKTQKGDIDTNAIHLPQGSSARCLRLSLQIIIGPLSRFPQRPPRPSSFSDLSLQAYAQ